MLGCEWQEKHWLELKRGPSPLFLQTSWAHSSPALLNHLADALNFGESPCQESQRRMTGESPQRVL